MRFDPALIRKSLWAFVLVMFVINKLVFWLSFLPVFQMDENSHPCACTGESVCHCGPEGCCGFTGAKSESNNTDEYAIKNAPCGPLGNLDSHLVDCESYKEITPQFQIALTFTGQIIQPFDQIAQGLLLLPDPPVPKSKNF
jgi:hypothetical protein